MEQVNNNEQEQVLRQKEQDILEQYWKLDKKGFVMDFDTAEAIKMGVQALDNQRSKQ